MVLPAIAVSRLIAASRQDKRGEHGNTLDAPVKTTGRTSAHTERDRNPIHSAEGLRAANAERSRECICSVAALHFSLRQRGNDFVFSFTPRLRTGLSSAAPPALCSRHSAVGNRHSAVSRP